MYREQLIYTADFVLYNVCLDIKIAICLGILLLNSNVVFFNIPSQNDEFYCWRTIPQFLITTDALAKIPALSLSTCFHMCRLLACATLLKLIWPNYDVGNALNDFNDACQLY
jgi:hypothetical protein